MKRLLVLILAMSAFSLQAKTTYSDCFNGETATDVYKIRMRVGVPRIYDNMQSLGYRKYQWQVLEGEMHITYPVLCGEEDYSRPSIEIKNLINKKHKINGKNITYKCTVNNDGDAFEGPVTRVNVIGNNKTDVFRQASVVFYLDAEPDYSIGEDDEDNSLLITLGGYGTVAGCNWYPYYCCGNFSYRKYFQKIEVISRLRGYLGGTLGCGCKAYGHKSPTRVMGYDGHTSRVDDVASVFGIWTAVYKGRL